MPSTIPRSPFLDILPPELRLHIYAHLLISPLALKGPAARQTTKYALHTAILRTNKQIHNEARTIFLGRNTFCITSTTASTSTSTTTDGCAFEPPLQLNDLPLLRHLEIDLLYYHSRVLRTTVTDPETGAWRPVCVGAERYASCLAHVLGAVRGGLLTLGLAADSRRRLEIENGDKNEDQMKKGDEEILDVKKYLTGFYTVDKNPRFKRALADLGVEKVALHFNFPESYFKFVVDRDVLCGASFADLAGQVLVKSGEFRLRAAMAELGEVDEDFKREGNVDLIPRQ
ncbi:hypothetical protein EJ02DRAFT_343914 [Clathrospora elynae]|uniref:F-box domain-containing protein n=1 Tax=Clathrospora elynae TaxID=706981 RepID=A0A6A5STR9_9PLEO|nr:hypothetical protein EJ02DRAFT_343914 [Clathrospora elynae]